MVYDSAKNYSEVIRMTKITSLRYYVPCHYCHTPILVDQPVESKFRITEVVCERCLDMINRNDTRIIGVIKKRESERMRGYL